MSTSTVDHDRIYRCVVFLIKVTRNVSVDRDFSFLVWKLYSNRFELVCAASETRYVEHSNGWISRTLPDGDRERER